MRLPCPAGRLGVLGGVCLALVLPGCSLKKMAIQTVADSLSEGTRIRRRLVPGLRCGVRRLTLMVSVASPADVPFDHYPVRRSI